jgi:hypothetical protein
MKEVIHVPQHSGSDDRTRLWEDQAPPKRLVGFQKVLVDPGASRKRR